MPIIKIIINTETLKTIHWSERCDTRFVLMRGSNSVIKTENNENENNKWKRNIKKRQKRTRGTEAIMKGWNLNDFVVHLKVTSAKKQ